MKRSWARHVPALAAEGLTLLGVRGLYAGGPRARRGSLAYNGGVLREKMVGRAEAARASGHLESIPTFRETFDRDGIRWIIRKKATTPQNPFLPYEPELFVVDVSETHVCLLRTRNTTPRCNKPPTRSA